MKADIRAYLAARRALPPPTERRDIRTKAGISLAAAAAEIGVSRGAVWHWEQGRQEPRGDNLIRYVKVLQMLRREAAA